ncbi:hypothetical protein AB205_0093680 [Aquarana catesbeiana]|uniref:MADF domain-containing protein n=1 Tax=Aquarana catesbeiana TaxID=8400 RepID=A0A2G9RWY4_AQUCT|nr:hypothetical protein AB205_0093680 [Aquarana catesbeiana]
MSDRVYRALELVKPVYPTADITNLKAKIGSLRSGASADDIYVPRLWYYNSLCFLSDQTEPRPSPSTLPSTSAEAPGPSTQEEDVEEPSLTQESLSQEEAVASSLTESQVPPLRPPIKRTRKARNLKEATAAFLRHATVAISMTPGGHEAFGCLTASKLEHMEEVQRTICEEIILQALNKGTRGELTRQTHLCELNHAPPPSPPTPQPPHHSSMEGSLEGSVESDGLGLVWSGKKHRLL